MARLTRAEYKRRYRAKRAAREGRIRDLLRCRDWMLHDSHVKEYQAYRKAIKAAIYRARLALHDAHVKRFKTIARDRARYLVRYKRDPEFEIARQSTRKAALPDSYVAQNLVAMGVNRSAIDEHLINLKREQMTLRRLSGELKKAAKQSLEENT